MELTDRNVLAAFRDMEQARRAIADLRDDGIPQDAISLLGQHLEDVDGPPVQGDEPSVRDGNVPGNVFAGVSIGTMGGGALGLAGTALVAAIPGVGIAGIGLLAGALAGAGLGGTVGGIVEGEAAMRTDHSWDQALEAVRSGAVVVGVHGEERVEHAVELLASHSPQTLHVTNDRGTVLEDHTSDDQPGPEVDPEAAFDEPLDRPEVAQSAHTDVKGFASRNARD